MTEDEGRLITVSLGQGQEPVAEKALDQMYTDGGWAMLENIELCPTWLPKLEKKLESFEEGAHPLFRCFLSAMPQPVVPVQSAPLPFERRAAEIYCREGYVSIARQSLLRLALGSPAKVDQADERAADRSQGQPEAFVPALHGGDLGVLEQTVRVQGDHLRPVCFSGLRTVHALATVVVHGTSNCGVCTLCASSTHRCFFHSVVCERRKFGPLGWNRGYPFNPGDLKDSIAVANNYLEAGGAIPWDDLRYLFGEVLYGGHITDAYDRILCTTYLHTYVRVELLDGIPMFPGFMSPPTMDYKGYLDYIDEWLGRETPIAYGLHPNAEINSMTQQATTLFNNISNLSHKSSGGGEGGMTVGEKVKQILDDILEKLPDLFPMFEILERIDDVTPYTGVFLQARHEDQTRWRRLGPPALRPPTAADATASRSSCHTGVRADERSHL